MSWCGNNRLKHRSDISPSLSCKGQQPHRGIRKRFIIGSILALIATVYFCWLKSRSRLSSASFTRRLAGANESAGEEYMLLGIDLEACGNLDNAAGLPGPTTVNVLRVYSKLPEMHSDEGPALGNRADNERVEMHLDTAPGQTATARIDEWLMDPIEDLEALINAETQASTPGSSLNCSNFPLVDQNVSALTGMKGVNPLLQLSNSPSAGHLDESVSGMSGDSTVTPNDYDGLQASIDQLTSEESALIDQLLDTLDEDLNLPELPATAAGPFLPELLRLAHLCFNHLISSRLNARGLPILEPSMEGGLEPLMEGGLEPSMEGGLEPLMGGGLEPWMEGGLEPWMEGGLEPSMEGELEPPMEGGLEPSVEGGLQH
ncbi:hypothetical protein, conserved [Eimeria tenella]|uniref:Uncharacterized protein n=1 Tax=Eimeria tenella TaxID=5802 RepID=U6KXY6_EIMTE|nr:hypothetical protein, conserved [Eimeria tenella]CDJ43002.1 hypothetical protein, conserved [Eimeria tenella]|eukprot:XP_013233752.1 hypothetical protein, conserved [Eimeria tenella]